MVFLGLKGSLESSELFWAGAWIMRTILSPTCAPHLFLFSQTRDGWPSPGQSLTVEARMKGANAKTVGALIEGCL